MTNFYDAFISYGRADSKAFAQKLQACLDKQGFKVWFDFNDIPLGVDFQNQIDDGIEKADNFLFIIAPHSVNSPYCLKEIQLAIQCHKRIIPLLHVEQIQRETWQQRNPKGTDLEWERYKAQGKHTSFQNMHPTIGKINWVYFREELDDFDKSLADLIALLRSHGDYVRQHTQFLAKALEWERYQKQTSYLLVGEEKQQAQAWLNVRFKDQQPPCTPTDLHCEYITESIKNGNNLMTEVFLSYADKDRGTMEKIRRSLRRQGITVWTNTTDIQTGETFQEAIERGIEKADNFVYLLSPDALNSTFCQQELDLALSLNKRIIPLLLRETDPRQVPSALQDLQYIDLTKNLKEEDYLDYLVDESELLRILHQDAAYYNQHKILLTKALKWARQQKNPSILARGYNLRSAETWLKVAQTRKQHRPTSLQEEFIAESLRQPPLESLDVFISYSRADSDLARKLNESLQMQGKTTWFDQESIALGTDFQQEIYRGIQTSDNFLFILSPRAVNSPYCKDEVEYAASLNKRFVTVLHQKVNTSDLHPDLAKVQWIDFNPQGRDFNANFNQLVRTLDTDREYLQSHTKWLQRALEWEQKQTSEDLLLRGSEFIIAREWLHQAEEQQKKPGVTPLQKEFIEASQKAIEAVRDEEERRQAEMLRLQEEKTKEAKTRLAQQKFFLVTVSAALVAAIGTSVWALSLSQKVVENQIKTLSQFSLVLSKFDRKFDALVEGIRAAKILKNVKTDKPEIKELVLKALQVAVYGEKGFRKRNLLRHEDLAWQIAFSPDSQTLASASWDNTVKLWNTKGQLLHTLQGHEDVIWSIAFSRNGQTIASASQDKTVKLWNTKGQLLHTLQGHEDTIYSIAFSPDSQTIASASDDKTVKLWNTKGQLLHTLQGHEDAIYSIAFSPDSQTVASASKDKTVKLWNTKGQLLHTLQSHKDEIRSIAFSTDGQTIASASKDKTVKLWNTKGQLLHTLQGHEYPVWNIAFSPDGQTLASASWDNTVKLWNTKGQLLQTLQGHEDAIYSIAFSPDGQTIASAGKDKTVKLWNAKGQLLQTLQGHEGNVNSIAFSSDGQTLASASWDNTVKLWNAKSQLLHTLQGHEDRVWGIAFSTDDRTLASASWDNTVKLWNTKGQLLHTLQGHEDRVWSIAFSSDDRTIASASWDKTVKLWNTKGQLLHTLQGHEDRVWDIAFSPDGQTIASTSSDKTVKLWNAKGRLLHTLQGHKDEVYSIAFSPDGQTIASASFDKTVKLWNAKGQLLYTLQGHKSRVYSITFSPDSQTLASASRDKTVKLWNAKGQLLHTLQGHKSTVNSIAFSPDGQTLASASQDKTVKLWNAKGQLLHTLQGHENWVNSIAFSPDGQTLASASQDKTVKLWNAKGQLLHTLQGHEEAVYSIAFSPDGQTLASASWDNTVILWKLADLTLDSLMWDACAWVGDYLKHNAPKEDRTLCQDISDKLT